MIFVVVDTFVLSITLFDLISSTYTNLDILFENSVDLDQLTKPTFLSQNESMFLMKL